MKNKNNILKNDKYKLALISISSVIASLVICAILIALAGINPLNAYKELLRGAFGDVYSICETLVATSPLIFTGLSVMFAKRCGLVNIGAEGQLYFGAIGATLASLWFGFLPALLAIPIAICFAFIFGGVGGAFAGWLKSKYGISEIISTIMINYIAMYLASFLVSGPIQDPVGFYPQSARIAKSTYLPILLSGTRLHLGFILALFCVWVTHDLLWKRTIGYQLRVVGLNFNAARYGGINIVQKTILGMFIAGGLAGLAGADQILGVQHRLIEYFSPRYGFDGIAIALLGQSIPMGTLLGALLFGVLRTGSSMMQRSVGVPATIIQFMQGLMLIFVVSAMNYKYLKGIKHSLKNFSKFITKTLFYKKEKV